MVENSQLEVQAMFCSGTCSLVIDSWIKSTFYGVRKRLRMVFGAKQHMALNACDALFDHRASWSSPEDAVFLFESFKWPFQWLLGVKQLLVWYIYAILCISTLQCTDYMQYVGYQLAIWPTSLIRDGHFRWLSMSTQIASKGIKRNTNDAQIICKYFPVAEVSLSLFGLGETLLESGGIF